MPADLRKVDVITRDAERLPVVVRAWFDGTGQSGTLPAEVEGLETVLLQAMRPILTRAADAILARRRPRRHGPAETARSAAASPTSR